MLAMNSLRKYLSAAALVTQVLFPAGTSAQESAPRFDFPFESRIVEINTELREADDAVADGMRRTFATELFDYYRQHPSTPTGVHAAEAAFQMWGDLADADAMEKALPFLTDSPVWSGILLIGISNAYTRSGRPDAHVELLRRLEGELTHPTARSEVLVSLGRLSFNSGQIDEAVARFEEVVALDAYWFAVQVAQEYLYEIEELAIGRVAPDFSAQTLDGNSLSLSALRGQPVLLEFWATWCGPCIPEIPHLKQLHDEYGKAGLQLVGISFDGDPNKLRQFLADEAMPWVQIRQQSDLQGELAKLFNVQGIPRSFLLDRNGRIVAKNLRGEALEAAVVDVMESRDLP